MTLFGAQLGVGQKEAGRKKEGKKAKAGSKARDKEAGDKAAGKPIKPAAKENDDSEGGKPSKPKPKGNNDCLSACMCLVHVHASVVCMFLPDCHSGVMDCHSGVLDCQLVVNPAVVVVFCHRDSPFTIDYALLWFRRPS